MDTAGGKFFGKTALILEILHFQMKILHSQNSNARLIQHFLHIMAPLYWYKTRNSQPETFLQKPRVTVPGRVDNFSYGYGYGSELDPQKPGLRFRVPGPRNSSTILILQMS